MDEAVQQVKLIPKIADDIKLGNTVVDEKNNNELPEAHIAPRQTPGECSSVIRHCTLGIGTWKCLPDNRHVLDATTE